MAKLGDHVDTIYGPATIIAGRRVALHNVGGDAVYDIVAGVILAVTKTKEQLAAERLERDAAAWHYIVNGN